MAKTRSSWKTQYQLLDSASNFHNKVRGIFATDPYFRHMRCYQEVNVRDLVPDYPFGNHHFDWFVDELQTIIELQGQQHYHVVNYGNIGYEEAQRAHLKIKERDNFKKLAAETANYKYIAISYREYEKLNANRLKQLILCG